MPSAVEADDQLRYVRIMSDPLRDTADEAARAQREAWRRMGPSRRLELAMRMSDDVRQIAIDGELARHPGISRAEALARVVRRTLGDELFEAATAEGQTFGRR